MKKTFSMVALAATLLLSSCGFGTGTSTTSNTNTNSSLGTALGTALLSGATNSSSSDLLSSGLSILGNLLGANTVNTNTIVGTWTYAQPQVSFESNNVLSQVGGELMGNKIESALGTQLQKIGLKQGVSKFTFDNSGNVTLVVSGKTTTGTYKLNGNQLTMTGALGLGTITCTVSINSNQLYMLFNANTLFNALTKLGSNNSSISSLLSSFNGMKLGWSMTK